MNPSKSLYNTFAPAERLILMLEAMAREDHGEADRLREACPQKSYRSLDLDFWQRAIVSFDTAAVACSDLMHLCGKLQMLSWVREILDTSTALAGLVAEGAFLDGMALANGDRAEPQEGEPQEDSASRRCEAIQQQVADNGQKLRAVVSSVELHWASILATAWEAFTQFARTRPGLEPKTLLRAWKLPAAAEVEPLLQAHPQVQADPEQVEEYFQALCILWDTRFRDFQLG